MQHIHQSPISIYLKFKTKYQTTILPFHKDYACNLTKMTNLNINSILHTFKLLENTYLVRCNGNKGKNDFVQLPLSFTWDINVASQYGKYCYLYRVKRDLNLFIMNVESLHYFKNSLMDHIQNSNHVSNHLKWLIDQFVKSTCIGLTSRRRARGNTFHYKDYGFMNKPLNKVRLIDAGSEYDRLTTNNIIFSQVLRQGFEILKINFDGWIYDPLLMLEFEDVNDYYIGEWNSEICLFKPQDCLSEKATKVNSDYLLGDDSNIILKQSPNDITASILNLNEINGFWKPPT